MSVAIWLDPEIQTLQNSNEWSITAVLRLGLDRSPRPVKWLEGKTFRVVSACKARLVLEEVTTCYDDHPPVKVQAAAP